MLVLFRAFVLTLAAHKLFRFSSTQIVKTELYAVMEGTGDPSESSIVIHPDGIIG